MTDLTLEPLEGMRGSNDRIKNWLDNTPAIKQKSKSVRSVPEIEITQTEDAFVNVDTKFDEEAGQTVQDQNSFTAKTLKAMDFCKTFSNILVFEDKFDDISINSAQYEIQLEKKQRFWDFLTMITSMIYGVALFMIGIVVYSTDLLFSRLFTGSNFVHHYSEAFNIYLCLIGTVFLIGLIYDLYGYINTIQRKCSDVGKIQLVEDEKGEFNLQLPVPAFEKKKKKETRMPEYYCFTTGRHSGSFYLKIGASIFCFGHLVRVMLNSSKQIQHLMVGNPACASGIQLAFEIMYAIFSFVQLFMIFRFGNVIVNRNKILSQFAFMHCISSSLCFWIFAIMNETMDALVEKYYSKKSYNSCHHRTPRANREFPACDQDNTTQFSIGNNIICGMELKDTCGADVDSVSSLLYPFSIEFNILVVAVWYIMWSNIGNMEQHSKSIEFLPPDNPSSRKSSLIPVSAADTDLIQTAEDRSPSAFVKDEMMIDAIDAIEDAMVISADCGSSVRGLFNGLFMLVVTIACVIVHLTWQNSCNQVLVDASLTLSYIIECIILSVMIIATIWTYINIVKLDINPHSISFLDDLLLLICIPSYFLLFAFSLAPNIFHQFEPLTFITDALTIIQVTVQTPLIVDGLRRCSETKENLKTVPGKNTLMFLIVANLVHYIFYIFMQKSSFYEAHKNEFYGKLEWTIISHIALPLCIFYRFHASVALVDIWNSAYKPAD